MVITRDFSLDDQALVRSLILDGLRERWGELYDPTRNPDLDDIARSYLQRGSDVVVAEADGELVAVGMLIPRSARQGQIVRMSVAARVRRRGVGRMVVEDLLDRARRRGMSEVVVLTDTDWTSAVALYRACGFDETGRDSEDTHLRIRL
jgi:ribosomal protein S18 acetylase RimI-like enzyme